MEILQVGQESGNSAPRVRQAAMTSRIIKPRLLVTELWALGDLVLGTSFLRAAVEKYDVTILAKPYAEELRDRFWPGVKVMPFTAPWTAFRRKYHLLSWPWREMFRLARVLRSEHYDVAVSARWDPRNHLLLVLAGARQRFGFPRLGSQIFLTHPLVRPEVEAHRYEYWRRLGMALGLEVPPMKNVVPLRNRAAKPRQILVHTGAAQPVRVWPLENYRQLIACLRQKEYCVQIACDPNQRDWWLRNGEAEVATPRNVTELIALVDQACGFIGNDSGPGHLAAVAGVPTFTLFGPQLPEWFAPVHPAAQWIEGKACPYKPCSDYCRFAQPICLTGWSEPEIWAHIELFLQKLNGHG
jgi:ADP-heptose:LPS heptosyltransferase